MNSQRDFETSVTTDNSDYTEVEIDDNTKSSESVVSDEKKKRESRFSVASWFRRKKSPEPPSHTTTEVFVDVESTIEYDEEVSYVVSEPGVVEQQQGEKAPEGPEKRRASEVTVTVGESKLQEEKISSIAPWYRAKQKPIHDSEASESVANTSEVQRQEGKFSFIPSWHRTRQRQDRDSEAGGGGETDTSEVQQQGGRLSYFTSWYRARQKQDRDSEAAVESFVREAQQSFATSTRENQQVESVTSLDSTTEQRRDRDPVATEGTAMSGSEYTASNPDLTGKREKAISWSSRKKQQQQPCDPISSVVTCNTSATEDEYLDNVINAKEREEGEEKRPNSGVATWPRRKRLWAVAVAVILLLLAAFIPTLILMVLPAVYERAVNNFIFDFSELNIGPPVTDGSFLLDLKGQVTNPGSLKATVSFTDYVEVYWNGSQLGNFKLPPFTVAGNNQADISVNTTFYIHDNHTFANFSAFQMNNMEFTWTLSGQARVRALGVTRDRLDFNKEVTMHGANGFPGAKVTYFNLEPSTSSTLLLNLTVDLVNLSPIGIQLGTLGVEVFSGNAHLGHATADNCSLVSGINSINFKGMLIPQATNTSQDDLNNFITNYITGVPTDLAVIFDSAKPDGVNDVYWLGNALQTVTMNATLIGYPRQIITGINIGWLNVIPFVSSPEQIIPSPNISANYSLPFEFPFNITKVEQNITIYDRNDYSLGELYSPWTDVTSDDRTIHLNSVTTWLYVNDDQKSNFSQFTSALTANDTSGYQLSSIFGISMVTPVGSIILKNIQFNTTATSSRIT